MSQSSDQHVMASPSTPVMPGNQVGKYRRNGKLQSCEPCRKSKLKCDHTVPTCGRCIKRRCIDQCIYHPNPLTVQNRHATFRQTPKRTFPTPSSSSRGQASPVETRSTVEDSLVENGHGNNNRTSLQDHSDTQSTHRAASAPPLHLDTDAVIRRGSEFLGDNTYKSIFKDDLGNLGVIATDLESPEVKNLPIGKDRILQGCQILSAFKNQRMINGFVSKWYEMSEGSGVLIIEPMAKDWLRKLWLCHGEVLEQQKPEKLEQLSTQLWRNSQRPLRFDGKTTAYEWADLSTGQNIRWEVLGIIAAIVGMCASYADAQNVLFKENHVSRATLTKQFNDISQACLSFCRECNLHDDLFLWLLVESTCLVNVMMGDSNFMAYRALGETIDAVVAMGYHQEINVNSRVPFFLAELRKRARTTAYFGEVGVASFLGRPPRASWRYWNLDPPVDLTDAQLMLDVQDLNSILATFDENGFNTDERIVRGTFERLWIGFAPRREDILDLALGKYSREEIIRHSETIYRKIEEHWKRLPDFIRNARYEIPGTEHGAIKTLYLTIIRQATQANDLLLQRILIRKAGASSERLVKTAYEILRDVMDIGSRPEMATSYSLEITGLLVVHGLRASAIIAVELLKQEQLPVYPKEPLLPRSQTIQELSVFASRLGAVDSSDGLYSMCQQGQKVITRILDKILAPPSQKVESTRPDESAASSNRNQEVVPMDVDMLNAGIFQPGPSYMPYLGGSVPVDITIGPQDSLFAPENETMFMQWLDNTDWDRQGAWFSQMTT